VPENKKRGLISAKCRNQPRLITYVLSIGWFSNVSRFSEIRGP
jgi:hypothetical protein